MGDNWFLFHTTEGESVLLKSTDFKRIIENKDRSCTRVVCNDDSGFDIDWDVESIALSIRDSKAEQLVDLPSLYGYGAYMSVAPSSVFAVYGYCTQDAQGTEVDQCSVLCHGNQDGQGIPVSLSRTECLKRLGLTSRGVE